MQYLRPGTRTTIVGKTGTGKTTLAVALVSRSSQKWLIVDIKKDDKFPILNPAYTESLDPQIIGKLWEKHQFVCVNPVPGTDPLEVDNLIYEMYENYKNFGVFIDELYSIHKQGQAGKGLVAVCTRGRSDKITLLGLTQRPRWVSLFVLSESEEMGIFHLKLKQDRQRVYEITGREEVLNSLANHACLWYRDSVGSLTHLQMVN